MDADVEIVPLRWRLLVATTARVFVVHDHPLHFVSNRPPERATNINFIYILGAEIKPASAEKQGEFMIKTERSHICTRIYINREFMFPETLEKCQL